LHTRAFRIELGPELFLLPATFIIALSVLTIVARTLRASLANPASSLKKKIDRRSI